MKRARREPRPIGHDCSNVDVSRRRTGTTVGPSRAERPGRPAAALRQHRSAAVHGLVYRGWTQVCPVANVKLPSDSEPTAKTR